MPYWDYIHYYPHTAIVSDTTPWSDLLRLPCHIMPDCHQLGRIIFSHSPWEPNRVAVRTSVTLGLILWLLP